MQKLRPRRDLAALRERVAASAGADSPSATPAPPAESPTSLPANETASPKHVPPNALTWEAAAPAQAASGDAAEPEAGAGPEQGLPAMQSGSLEFSLVGSRAAASSLLDVLVGEASELVLRELNGRALARMGCCCLELRALASSQALWQRVCYAEWGEAGWRPGVGNGVSGGTGGNRDSGERKPGGADEEEAGGEGSVEIRLGQRVVQRMLANGRTVDQFTHNALMDLAVVSRGSTQVPEFSKGTQHAATAVWDEAEYSPLDGMALGETMGQRGAAGPSRIDWRRTYAQLARMEDACALHSARTAMATPGTGRAKSTAALACLAVVAAQASFWVEGASVGGGGRPARRVQLRAARSSGGGGGLLPHALVLSCGGGLRLPLTIMAQVPGERPRAIAQVDGAEVVERGACALGRVVEAGRGEATPRVALVVAGAAASRGGVGGRGARVDVRRVSLSLSLADVCTHVLQCSTWTPPVSLPPAARRSGGGQAFWIRAQMRAVATDAVLWAAGWVQVR
ncbi:hypothetical protein T484DRAFT_1770659 [Baffinella frigidus]|nr:hypothetical protein T484DRAFT_1770659 [Cryptophyta sp. CCMP2293]